MVKIATAQSMVKAPEIGVANGQSPFKTSGQSFDLCDCGVYWGSGVGNGEAPGAGAHPCSSMSKFK